MRLRNWLIPVSIVSIMVAGLAPAQAATKSAGDPHGPKRTQAAVSAQATKQGRQVSDAVASGSRLMVTLRDGKDSAGLVADAARHGAKLVRTIPKLKLVVVKVKPGDTKVRGWLKGDKRVLSVENDVVQHFSDVPNDTDWANESSYLGSGALNLPAAWDVTHGSAGIKIAVVDSGVDTTHPDLAGKIVGQYNAVDGSSDVTDYIGHGTFVAGVAAAATNNSAGIAGTGYDSSILAVKVADPTGTLYVSDEIAGVVWAADHGANVINISLGNYTPTTAELNGIVYAQNAGALVVAAAGNDGISTPGYPAAYPNVLAVGASDLTGGTLAPASFSNFGPWVSLAAPGVGIEGTTPLAGSTVFPGTTGYNTGDGTSFSTPIVSGIAALLFARSPGISWSSVRTALIDSGHGLAGDGLGSRKVDAAVAVAEVAPATVPTITAPTFGATVAGEVPLTATTTADSVQFYVDGAPVGAPVAASSGSASTLWESWATPNGAHAVTAADCGTLDCNPTTAAPVDVTLANDPTVLTAPAAGAVSNSVLVSATTPAPLARLAVNGVGVGAPFAVAAGTATITWKTAGYANGAATVGIEPCTTTGGCGAPATVAVTIANAKPVLTAPKSGAIVSGTVAMTATAASGGVRFYVDGATVGFDGSAPYSLSRNWTSTAEGTHTLTVRSCSSDGSLCLGPLSNAVTITVKNLHPKITATTPWAISPNGDGRQDSTKITYYLPSVEAAIYQVLNAGGAVVRSGGLGTLAAGSHYFNWNGKTAAGVKVPEGRYTVAVLTHAAVGGYTLYGRATTAVLVDTIAPRPVIKTGAGTYFYPYVDGYLDYFVPTFTTTEASSLTFTVKNAAGYVVRSLAVSASKAGTYRVSWNGRNSTGVLQPAGVYKFFVTGRDSAANIGTSGTYAVTLSMKKLTTVSTTLSVYGDAASQYLVDDVSYEYCLSASTSSSYYLDGVWLDNTCDPTTDGNHFVAAEYRFLLPAAVRYYSFDILTAGNTVNAPNSIDGLIYNSSTSKYDVLPGASVGVDYSDVAVSLGAVSAPGYYDSSRVVDFAVVIGDWNSSPNDWDIGAAGIKVSYAVLK